MRIDTEYAVYGEPTMRELADWFRQGPDEEYAVQAIRNHLLTDAQKRQLFDADLSIEDMLNGRFGLSREGLVKDMFADWNEKLGETQFGFDVERE